LTAALKTCAGVLDETPVAHDLDAAEQMAAAARERDAVTATAFNYRFVLAIRYVIELTESEEIREIQHIWARYLQDWLVDPDAPWSWHNSSWVAGSGALGDLGTHSIDLAQYLVGSKVERVSRRLRTFVDERPVPSGSEGSQGGRLGEQEDAAGHGRDRLHRTGRVRDYDGRLRGLAVPDRPQEREHDRD